MTVNSARVIIFFIGLFALIIPAEAILSESQCFAPHHCLQIRSAGLCFFPNPNPPTPSACGDENLAHVLNNHVTSKNHTPSNAYWHLASGAFLGGIHTHQVDSPVALCHTGPVYGDHYFTICRHAVRDNDLGDAATMPSCSIVHKNGKALQRDGCSIDYACGTQRSKRDHALEIIAITTAPAAYLEYIALGIKLVRWGRPTQDAAHVHDSDIEVGILGDAARNPFRSAFHLGVGFTNLFTDGRMQGLFDPRNSLIALARINARVRTRTRPT